ncbi:unnamed protein product, partial [Rhizoctonia solani]
LIHGDFGMDISKFSAASVDDQPCTAQPSTQISKTQDMWFLPPT